VIHSRVEHVSVSRSGSSDSDGLNRSVPGVSIKRLEQKDSEFLVAIAVITIPGFTKFTILEFIGCTFIVRNDLEVGRSTSGSRISLESGVFKIDEDIVRCGTRERTTISYVCPGFFRCL